MLLKPRLWIVFLLCLFCVFQYRLWIADGGIPSAHQLQTKVNNKRNKVQRLQARNKAMVAEIADLKSGNKAIEGLARSELGMVGKGETFYLLVYKSKNVHSMPSRTASSATQ